MAMALGASVIAWYFMSNGWGGGITHGRLVLARGMSPGWGWERQSEPGLFWWFSVKSDEICIPLWILAALFTSLACGIQALSRYSRRRIGKCVTCGYDLTGLDSPRCPECGNSFHAPVTNPQNRPPARSRSAAKLTRRRAVSALLILLAMLIVAGSAVIMNRPDGRYESELMIVTWYAVRRSAEAPRIQVHVLDHKGSPIGGQLLSIEFGDYVQIVNTNYQGYFEFQPERTCIRAIDVWDVERITWQDEIKFEHGLRIEIRILSN
jgi:hypothetical protein